MEGFKPIARTGEDFIEMYLKFSENTISPISYHKWMALSCLSAVAQRKIWLVHGHGNVYPNLFVILVGPTANGKGLAMRVGKDLIKKYVPAVKLSPDSTSRRGLMEDIMKAKTGGSFYDDTDDTTGSLMHRSMTCMLEECINFFSVEPSETRDFLIEAYDCRDFYHKTKHHGEEDITNMYLNFMGATTEQIVKRLLPEDAFSGGFASRIIFIYEERARKRLAFPKPIDRVLEKKLANDLNSIAQTYGVFKWSAKAGKWYEKWLEEYLNDLEKKLYDPRMDGFYYRKSDITLFKMSQLMSLAESNELVIEVRHLERSLEFLEEVEPKMKGAFTYLGENKLAITMSEIEKQVKLEGQVEYGKLLSLHSYNIRFVEFQEILATLKSCGKIDIVRDDSGKLMVTWKQGADDDISKV